MPIPFPSQAWIRALVEVLNTDADYADTARNWEADVTILIEPEGSLTKPFIIYLDLWHGQCREARELSDSNEQKAAFTLSAPLSVFVRILQGQLDPMQAMITRQLKVDGSMVYMMKNVPTVLKFVKTCGKVDTEFPL